MNNKPTTATTIDHNRPGIGVAERDVIGVIIELSGATSVST